MNKTNITENKLINSTKSFVGVCNKVVEYINSILLLPPQGEATKAQVVKEVKDLFKEKELWLNEQDQRNAHFSTVSPRSGIFAFVIRAYCKSLVTAFVIYILVNKNLNSC